MPAGSLLLLARPAPSSSPGLIHRPLQSELRTFNDWMTKVVRTLL